MTRRPGASATADGGGELAEALERLADVLLAVGVAEAQVPLAVSAERRAGQGRHAEEPPTDPKRHAKASFAREIAQTLDDERRKNSFAELTVVAPPQFLGDLRGAMSGELRALIDTEINKDLTKLPLHELTPQLQDLLFS